jgi:hypothetical protein
MKTITNIIKEGGIDSLKAHQRREVVPRKAQKHEEKH